MKLALICVLLGVDYWACAVKTTGPIEQTGVQFEVPIGRKTVSGTFLKSTLPGDTVPVYLVHQPAYYDRPELYRENGHDYKDNCEGFGFSWRATLEGARLLEFETRRSN